MNLTVTNYDWKSYVGWLFETRWGKILRPQKWTFKEKAPNISWLPSTMLLLKQKLVSSYNAHYEN